MSAWQRLKHGMRDRDLIAWLGAAALCALLDEILVAFGTMHLRDDLGMAAQTRAWAFGLCSVGAVVGLFATDWLLQRMLPLRLLLFSCAACTAMFGTWLLVTDLWMTMAALAGVGLFLAPMYPICSARAYGLRPGQPGLVAAVDQLFAPIAFGAPLIVGLVADRFGVTPALTLLLLQPIGVAFVAGWAIRRPTTAHADQSGGAPTS